MHQLPPTLFEFIPELYPFFIQVLAKCQLTGPEFFTLSFLRRSRTRVDGRPARLISQLARTLAMFTGSGKSQASQVIAHLHARGFLQKRDISEAEREKTFPGAVGGKNKVVVLSVAGEKVLDQFNAYVSTLFNEVVRKSGISVRIVEFLASKFTKIAPKLIDASHELTKRWVEKGDLLDD